MAVALVTTSAGLALRAELPDDGVAYVDADVVLPGLADGVPALVVDDRSARWDLGPEVELPAGMAAERAAHLAFGSVAREAAAAVDASGRTEVIGKGVVAAMVRRLVPQARGDGSGEDGPPRTIVDTTGDPAVLEAATRRLADLGILVMAGEPLGRRLSLDLYPDVHRRGLRLVGVAPPLADPMVLVDARDGVFVEPPTPVAGGSPLSPATWYRLSA